MLLLWPHACQGTRIARLGGASLGRTGLALFTDGGKYVVARMDPGMTMMDRVYKHEVHVTAAAVDANGHANNVAYIQWMQDAAIHHARATGSTAIAESIGATWVVRTHRVEYLRPVFAGETIRVLTWVANFRKVQSLRKYKLVRAGDETVVAQAETDWVFVDAKTGRPRAIPDEIRNTFSIVSKEKEP
ncbi:MAG TPA: thioesterase family protein [Verrucomicrobiae bacterium]|nr:thioesterase family protein [Verrucomicrobiae bacterium]